MQMIYMEPMWLHDGAQESQPSDHVASSRISRSSTVLCLKPYHPAIKFRPRHQLRTPFTPTSLTS